MSKNSNVYYLDTGYYDENEYGEPSRNYNSNVCFYIHVLLQLTVFKQIVC